MNPREYLVNQWLAAKTERDINRIRLAFEEELGSEKSSQLRSAVAMQTALVDELQLRIEALDA